MTVFVWYDSEEVGRPQLCCWWDEEFAAAWVMDVLSDALQVAVSTGLDDSWTRWREFLERLAVVLFWEASQDVVPESCPE